MWQWQWQWQCLFLLLFREDARRFDELAGNTCTPFWRSPAAAAAAAAVAVFVAATVVVVLGVLAAATVVVRRNVPTYPCTPRRQSVYVDRLGGHGRDPPRILRRRGARRASIRGAICAWGGGGRRDRIQVPTRSGAMAGTRVCYIEQRSRTPRLRGHAAVGAGVPTYAVCERVERLGLARW